MVASQTGIFQLVEVDRGVANAKGKSSTATATHLNIWMMGAEEWRCSTLSSGLDLPSAKQITSLMFS
jgi:hypothetical protein